MGTLCSSSKKEGVDPVAEEEDRIYNQLEKFLYKHPLSEMVVVRIKKALIHHIIPFQG